MANEELYQELRKLSKMANQRILRLEREFGRETYAIQNLRNKLDNKLVNAWTESGRVRYNKSMSEAQMKATIRALEKFQYSIQSRVKGANAVADFRRKQVAKAFNMDEREIDRGDIEIFYKINEEKKSMLLEKINPSKFMAVRQEAKEMNKTFDDFLKDLDQIKKISNDEDLVKDAKRLYNKYVKRTKR